MRDFRLGEVAAMAAVAALFVFGLVWFFDLGGSSNEPAAPLVFDDVPPAGRPSTTTTTERATTTTIAGATSTASDADHGHTHDEPVATYPIVEPFTVEQVECLDALGHIHPKILDAHIGDEAANECHAHTCETPVHSTGITYTGEPFPCPVPTTEAPTTTAAETTSTPPPTTTAAETTSTPPPTTTAAETTEPDPVSERYYPPGYPDVYSLTANPDVYYYRTDDPDRHAPLDPVDVCAGIDWPGAPTLTDGDHVPTIGTLIYEDVCWLDNQRYCRSDNPYHGPSDLYYPCPYDVPNTRVDACPSTATADAVLNVTRWPVSFRDFPTLNALNLDAGTYRAEFCFRYNNPWTGIPGFLGRAVWFYPTGEGTNTDYHTDRFVVFPVGLLAEVDANDEATFVIPHSGAWSFRPFGLINATWRLALWKTA